MRKPWILALLVVLGVAGVGVSIWIATGAIGRKDASETSPSGISPGIFAKPDAPRKDRSLIDRLLKLGKPAETPSTEARKGERVSQSGIAESTITELAARMRDGAAGQWLKKPFPPPTEISKVESELDQLLYGMADELGRPLPRSTPDRPIPNPGEYKSHVENYGKFKKEYEQNYPTLEYLEKEYPEQAAEAKKVLFLKWSMYRLEDIYHTKLR